MVYFNQSKCLLDTNMGLNVCFWLDHHIMKDRENNCLVDQITGSVWLEISFNKKGWYSSGNFKLTLVHLCWKCSSQIHNDGKTSTSIHASIPPGVNVSAHNYIVIWGINSLNLNIHSWLLCDPPENCHLIFKKLPKSWHFFKKELPKFFHFWQFFF